MSPNRRASGRARAAATLLAVATASATITLVIEAGYVRFTFGLLVVTVAGIGAVALIRSVTARLEHRDP